jgi:hypothetical protein
MIEALKRFIIQLLTDKGLTKDEDEMKLTEGKKWWW